MLYAIVFIAMYGLLADSATTTTTTTAAVCAKAPYQALLPLSAYAGAQAYCTSHFPLALCTTTTTITSTSTLPSPVSTVTTTTSTLLTCYLPSHAYKVIRYLYPDSCSVHNDCYPYHGHLDQNHLHRRPDPKCHYRHIYHHQLSNYLHRHKYD